MAYDLKSYQLAEYFTVGETPLLSEEEISALAQHIQDAIEAWFEARRREQKE